MKTASALNYAWLAEWMSTNRVGLWAVADLTLFYTPLDANGQKYPSAISWTVPMDPKVMASIKTGPNQAYANAYAIANDRIDSVSNALASVIKKKGFHAQALAASDRTDKVGIKGDFSHKTAATQAGLGWIGRHCQLITRQYGSWVRLGTVFTDMALPFGLPFERGFCGRCFRCIDACPAGALKGEAWYAGLPRSNILDVKVCDEWKKENYHQFHNGHNCGICSAVCPYGLKMLKRQGM